jgi:hypothetical protein
MEHLENYNKEDFSDPKFYKSVFEYYLETKDISGRQWLTGVSLFMQTMRTQIGSSFDNRKHLEEIDSFVKSSLSEDLKKYEIPASYIEESKGFVAQVVNILDEL